MSLQIPEKYQSNSRYAVGKLELRSSYAKLITSNEHQKLLIDKDHLCGAYDGDTVVVQKIFNPRAKFKAKVVEVLKSDLKKVLCYVKQNKAFSLKENVLLKSVVLDGFQDDDVVLTNKGKVEEHLGSLQDSRIDEKISLYLYNEQYRLEKMKEASSKEGTTIATRTDLRDLPFCTIDPASAKDHDDAIYYDSQNQILYVAIADVSAFVEQDSILDKEAKKRALSMYLPGKVLPMLPAVLSEDLCSLKPEVDRFAFVFAIYLDTKENKVIKSDLFEAIINSKRKFSYGRIDRVLDGQYDQHSEEDKNIFKSLEVLYKITKEFKKDRLKKGYDFRTSEYRLILDHETKLKSISKEESSPSHSLVEECMLLANIEAAKRVGNMGIFRVHDEPNLQKINQLVTDINLLGLNITPKKTTHQTIIYAQKRAKEVGLSSEVDELIIKAQQQAHYASKNGGHFGLGFEHYSHFTSPIRRYSDLVLHRILKTNKVSKEIDVVCDHISVQERNITSCVWDFEDRKYARWANDNIGKIVLCKIVDVEKNIVEILEDATGAKVKITNYKGQKLFSKCRVKITKGDIATKEIYGEVQY